MSGPIARSAAPRELFDRLNEKGEAKLTTGNSGEPSSPLCRSGPSTKGQVAVDRVGVVGQSGFLRSDSQARRLRGLRTSPASSPTGSSSWEYAGTP